MGESDSEPPEGELEEDEGDEAAKEELFPCNICEENLPLGDFPQRGGKRMGSVCDDCQLAVEGVQRQMRNDVGKEKYQLKWKNLKKDRDRFRQTILQHRENNQNRKGRGIRKIKAKDQVMTQSKSKKVLKKHRKRRKPSTLNAFLDKRMSTAGGSYTKGQALAEWRTFKELGYKVDYKGRFQGKTDQQRYWMPVTSSSESASEEEEKREVVTHGKTAKRLRDEDVDDFLDGEADLDFNIAVPETHAQKRQQKQDEPQSSPAKSRPANAASSSRGGDGGGASAALPAKRWEGQLHIEKARSALQADLDENDRLVKKCRALRAGVLIAFGHREFHGQAWRGSQGRCRLEA